MSKPERSARRIEIEDLGGGVQLATFVGSELGLFGREDAPELAAFVQRAHRDPQVRAVVFTGSHPGRFVSHADLTWLQEDGAVIPPISRHITAVVARIAQGLGRFRLTRWLASKTPMQGAIQLDLMHRTLSLMTTSPTIFVAALNGSALGVGSEIAWACDLRLMADGDHFLGHLEVLLGFAPGAGGTQRLPRLIGTHRALVAILEGGPIAADEALRLGAIDEIVPPDQLIDRATERARYLAARPPAAIGAIKRAVNRGSAYPLGRGLHLERAEFLASLPQRQAQQIMREYVEVTRDSGELPVYRSGGYGAALKQGNAARNEMEMTW